MSYELLKVVQQGTSLFIKPFKVPGGEKKKHTGKLFLKNVFVILLSSSAVYVKISSAYNVNVGYCTRCVLLNLYTLCAKESPFFSLCLVED